MLQTGPAKKLIVYVMESEMYEGAPVYEALLKWLHDHNVSGATVTKAIAGFGGHGEYHQQHTLKLTENVPIRIEVVESARKIDSILPFVYDIVGKGLIEVMDTQIVKHTHTAEKEEKTSHEHIKLE